MRWWIGFALLLALSFANAAADEGESFDPESEFSQELESSDEDSSSVSASSDDEDEDESNDEGEKKTVCCRSQAENDSSHHCVLYM